MFKLLISFLISGITTSLFADIVPLGGYFYGNMAKPSGNEWQCPDSLALNKLQPHAWFFTFESVDKARKVLPENSTYWQSLNGEWRFHWAPNPSERPKNFYEPTFDASAWDKVQVPMSWNVAGIQKDGSLKYGIPVYSNQRVIFQHHVAVNDWKLGVMRTPPEDWATYKHRNEVGSYRRTFTIPDHWQKRKVYINFDGVDSFFYLYINGVYVGFSKNSRNLAQFDITPYLVKGENVVAAEVYRHSDGSFLESQDMFRLPGIFRDVYLTSKPEVQVRDVVAIPDYDDKFQNASLKITTYVSNFNKKKAKGYTVAYSLYENKLYSDETRLVANANADAEVAEIAPGHELEVKLVLNAGNKVKPWNAETPHRYTLVGELKDKKGRIVETFSTIVGFREIEIKDTPADQDEFKLAGRYYYLNGQPIKMKGVNRHETNPELGHAITREWMEKEVMLMKRANINHVRCSHYPCHPYWYYLCDKYGIYLENEANIESHQYYYGKESTSHPVELKNAHIARNMEMVHATVNNPSICIWSLGNEAGPGNNFVAAYNAIKAFDTSRPVQYERNNNIVDMGSNQYPSIAWVQYAVKGKADLKYPFHISEYAHSMGNACGNLIDYWDAIESTNFFIGGAIWDWVDQAVYNYDKETGERYWAYGGDFVNSKPNDGTFCMNGIMRPDLSPKGQYYEVKKVYQNVGVKAIDMKKGKIEIFNKNYFTPLYNYNIVWSLYKDGVCVEENMPLQGPRMVLGPREKQIYTLRYNFEQLDAQSEYFVKVQFLLNEDKPWAQKGYPQMEEQLAVKAADKFQPISNVAKGSDVKFNENGKLLTVKGEDFTVEFDTEVGSINKLVYNGNPVIKEGEGPKLSCFRAPTDNDNWAYHQWLQNGLHNLKHKVVNYTCLGRQEDGSVAISFTIESQAPYAAQDRSGNRDRNPEDVYTIKDVTNHPFGPNDFKFTTSQIWTVYPDGSVELQSAITSNKPNAELARLGYEMELSSEFNKFMYYGRGPINNYNDRKTAQNIELYKQNVGDEIILPKPQSMGNREEVRYVYFYNNDGQGVTFIANDVMSTSALPWSSMEILGAAHPYQLPKSTGVHLHLDAKVTGLGGNSCGQGSPLAPDHTLATSTDFGFIIRPLKATRGDKLSKVIEATKVSAAGQKPITITRDRAGILTLTSAYNDRTIMYTVNNAKKAQVYKEPINLRDGGNIKVWYKEYPEIVMSNQFDKIKEVPLQVVYASSVEGGEGDAAHFVDNDVNTLWHTMYSITLAKYPHWVDFDAGMNVNMKGFVYTPRMSGQNGMIKDYEIYVSNDGKEWGAPIVKDSFKKENKAQKVMFSKPVKARYIRLRGLNEQNGNDYASGAEFKLIAE